MNYKQTKIFSISIVATTLIFVLSLILSDFWVFIIIATISYCILVAIVLLLLLIFFIEYIFTILHRPFSVTYYSVFSLIINLVRLFYIRFILFSTLLNAT